MGHRSGDSGKKVIKRMGRTTTPTRLALLIVVFTLFGTAFAQTLAVVGTRITTVPPGLKVEFTVDGQTYKTPVTLLWPAGTKHTLHSYTGSSESTGYPGIGGTVGGDTRWQFNGSWITNRGTCPDPCIVTADPDITEVSGSFTVSYLIKVVFAVCGSDSPGTVLVNGLPFTCSGSLYAPIGPLALQASPNPTPYRLGSPSTFLRSYT